MLSRRIPLHENDEVNPSGECSIQCDAVIDVRMHEERRHHLRHPFHGVLEASASEDVGEEVLVIRGRVVDLSTGGAGVIADLSNDRVGGLPDDTSAVLKWAFYIPDVPVPLPLLAQIRWIEPISSPEGTVRLGLAFLP
jgi:PilZ domain